MSAYAINVEGGDMASRDHRARLAGEIIYATRSSQESTPRGYGSVETDRESVLGSENRQACCGRMSPVRRTFCLIALFDFILTCIVWVICIQVIHKNGSIWERFVIEIADYSFQRSLFDIVLCSAWRFVPHLLAYALFRINNPSVIAITTLVTCVLLLCKAFLYQFDNNDNNIIPIVLLLSSFALAWTQTWFLDFKVLPREEKTRQREALYQRPVDDRTPLLHDAESHYHYPPGDQYYSPIESSNEGSDHEAHEGTFQSLPTSRRHSRQPSASFTIGDEEEEYVQKAEEAWQTAWDIMHTEDGWKKEMGSGLEDGIVFSHTFPKIGKLFKLEVLIPASPQATFEELVLGCNDAPKWNTTVLECKTLQVINENTDISYNVAAQAAGGLVGSRDFVNLRHWATKDGIIMSAGCGVQHPDMPATKKHTRGENRPGGWAFKPVDGERDQCLFVWIVNTDLKGWIPQSVVDAALSGTLLEFVRHLKNRMGEIKGQGQSHGRHSS